MLDPMECDSLLAEADAMMRPGLQSRTLQRSQKEKKYSISFNRLGCCSMAQFLKLVSFASTSCEVLGAATTRSD
eukprot:1724946-Amphidinium_carterae.1